MEDLTASEPADEKFRAQIARQDSISSLQANEVFTRDLWKRKALGFGPPSAKDRPSVWWETWLHFGPLSGLLAMVLTALSLTASLGILVGSNGQSVNGWSAPPSTYIAIFTAISNMSVRYAATQGVIIAWWKKASMGSTVSRLHSDWTAGTMLRGALAAGRGMGLLGLACVFSTVVVIDGPLLQRASTVIEIANPATVSLEISMVPEIPHAFSGTWFTPDEAGLIGDRNSFGFNSTLPSPNGPISNLILSNSNRQTDPVVAPWYNEEPIKGVVRGCPGECTAKIRAPALFAVACMTETYAVDLSQKYNVTAVEENVIAAPLEEDVIVIVAGLTVQNHETINLVTGFTTFSEEYKGDFHLQACTLASGIGEYDISIEDDHIIMSAFSSPTLIALANNTAVNQTWVEQLYGSYGHPSTLAGVVNTMQESWQSYISCFLDETEGGKGLDVLGVGQVAIFDEFQTKARQDHPGLCQSYRNPYDVVVKEMNKLMVYLGAKATEMDTSYLETHMDAGVVVNTTGIGYVQGRIDVYHTSYWFFLVAAILELVCLALIAPTYWGWWKLGRAMSFSPLEIAKAFKSPLLADYNSNSTGTDLAAAAANTPIQYGVFTSERSGENAELAFGDPTLISRPSQGVRFDN